MIRKIIRIDEEKCSGCGLCATAAAACARARATRARSTSWTARRSWCGRTSATACIYSFFRFVPLPREEGIIIFLT